MRRVAIFLLLVSVFSAVPAAAAPAIKILSQQGPKKITAGEDAEFLLRIENSGDVAWDPEQHFALGAHWFAADGEILKWDGPRTPLPHLIVPGEVFEIRAHCTAPDTPGPALLGWDVVREGLMWVSREMPEPPPPRPVEILRGPSFALEHADALGWTISGVTRRMSLEIRNKGGAPWLPGEGLALAAHWETPDGLRKIHEGLRTPIIREIPPGSTLHIEALLKIPSEPGRWLLRWDMVREGRYWFSEKMKEKIRPQLVVVLPASAPAWPALGVSICLLFFAFGLRRGWWPGRWAAAHLDLLWLVSVPLLVEVTILPEPWWITLLLLAALAACLDLLPSRLRPFFSLSAGSGLILLFLTDRIYFRFFGDLPSIGAAALLGQSDEVSASISSLLNPADMGFFLCMLTGFAVFLMRSKSLSETPLRTRLLRALPLTVLALLLLDVLAGLPPVAQVFRRAQVAEHTGVTAAHLLDAGGRIRRALLKTGVSERELRKMAAFFRESADTRRGRSPFFGMAAGRNFVLIQVESLQEFMVDLEIGGSPVMPTLRRWASEGILFRETTDQTGQGRSSDAELLSQVSLLPLPDGAASFSCDGNHFVSLAGEASRRGYTTLSAVPFDGSFWNRRRTHRAYGYGRSLFAEDFEPGRKIGWGLGDRDFLKQMGTRLAGLHQPFLAWMITLSLHHPFEGFPDDLQELDVGRFEGTPVGEYIHTMHYLDHALDDFEQSLRASGLWDHTFIMLWGDHDAGFRWTPEVARLMGVSADDLGWYRSQKIPLLLHPLPGSPSLDGIAADQPAGHEDIAPTAAALLGIDPSVLPWIGRNLLGNPGDAPLIGEYGCFSDRERIFLQGEDGAFSSGRCYQRSTLEALPPATCREAFLHARRIQSLSRRILEEDLQQKLAERPAR